LIARHHADASDADPEIAARMAQQFDPWPEAFVVGTLPPVADTLPTVIEHIDNQVRGSRVELSSPSSLGHSMKEVGQ
jgi:hypothetical protein